jgi:hypothetical protein
VFVLGVGSTEAANCYHLQGIWITNRSDTITPHLPETPLEV